MTRLLRHSNNFRVVASGVRGLLVLLLLAAPRVHAQSNGAAAGRVVAVTIDDLPFAGAEQDLEHATHTMDRMVAALRRYDAPASAFVTGANVLVNGQSDARLDLLRRWRDGGVRLENHGYAHLSYNETDIPAFMDEVAQGHLFPEMLMRERGDSVRSFRSPFNQTGATEEKKQALLSYLKARGVRLAPFTVEHADYAFNAIYEEALFRSDSALAERIGAAYVAQLDTALTFAEALSRETFGREIPQIFLIHSNRINAEYLDDLLERFKARGYSFASLDEALRDKVYDTPDPKAVQWGYSWLHRWRAALGLENRLRDEPDPPGWIMEAYQRLNEP